MYLSLIGLQVSKYNYEPDAGLEGEPLQKEVLPAVLLQKKVLPVVPLQKEVLPVDPFQKEVLPAVPLQMEVLLTPPEQSCGGAALSAESRLLADVLPSCLCPQVLLTQVSAPPLRLRSRTRRTGRAR